MSQASKLVREMQLVAVSQVPSLAAGSPPGDRSGTAPCVSKLEMQVNIVLPELRPSALCTWGGRLLVAGAAGAAGASGRGSRSVDRMDR